MLTKTISIEIDPETARFYDEASSSERRKLDLILKAKLRQYASGQRHSLKAAMDEMRRQAEENGLTPEILEELLKDE